LLRHLGDNSVDVTAYQKRLKAIPPTHNLPDDMSILELTVALSAQQPATQQDAIVHRVDTQSPYECHTQNNNNSDLRSHKPTTRGRPLYTESSSQCTACGQWGHTPSRCKTLAQWSTCTQHHGNHKEECNNLVSKWIEANGRHMRQATVRQLLTLHDSSYDGRTENDLTDHLELDIIPGFL